VLAKFKTMKMLRVHPHHRRARTGVLALHPPSPNTACCSSNSGWHCPSSRHRESPPSRFEKRLRNPPPC